MTIAKKVEEFKKLANESFARGGFLTTDYPGMAGVNEWELDPIAILAWLETSLREVEEEAKKEPHNTEDGYCCACGYDIAVMENKISLIMKGSHLKHKHKHKS